MTKSAQELLAGFDDYVEQELKNWNAPGMAVSVIHKGEVVLSRGYGKRNMADDLPVDAETVFAIGSCTKAFTTMGLALLVDDGLLDWDAPVRDYLPDFQMYDPVATEQMTPRDLVCHRSGLPRHDFMWYGSPYTREEIFARLRYLQPSKGFRYAFQYQNIMYMTAGYLAGKVAGMSWEDFTRERILKPLGMNDSNLHVTDSEKLDNFAQPYAEKDDELQPIPFRNLDAIGPAGSINSNLVDMEKWLLMHMRGGKHNGEQFVSEANLQQMYEPHTTMPSLPLMIWHGHKEVGHMAYALGWATQTYRGRTMIRHTGGIDGFIASVSFLPHEDIGVITFTNSGNSLPVITTFNVYDRLLGLDEIPWSERTKTLEAQLEEQAHAAVKQLDESRKPDTSPSHEIAAYAGLYEHEAYGVILIEEMPDDADNLRLIYNGITLRLEHHHYDFFKATGEGVEMVTLVGFGLNKDGDVAQLSIQLEPMVDDIIFNRADKEDA